MKKLFAVVLIALPLVSFANTLTFNCKSSELEGIHKFDAKGIVFIDASNKVSGSMSIEVQKAQEPESAQIFEEISVSGTRVHFEAGSVTSSAFDELNLTSNNPYIKMLSILLNINVEISSQIFTVDKFLYRSNCQIESIIN